MSTIDHTSNVGQFIPNEETVPRTTIQRVLASLREEVTFLCFREAHEEAERAYREVSDHTPWHESFTKRDEALLVTAQRDAYIRTFDKFLAVPENVW